MSNTVHSNRRRPRSFATVSEDTATQVIGQITEDTEIYGMTDGSLSLIDIIAHCLSQTDSRDVTMATWTAATGSLQAFRDLCRAKAIRTLRMIVDPSFRTRKPDDVAELHALYGDEALRFLPIHGKFCVMTGGRLPVTIRSSMNLNPNKRIESYEISTCQELADFHVAFADDVFSRLDPISKDGRATQPKRPISRRAGSSSFTPPKPLF